MKTIPLYYDDPSLLEFQARVLEVQTREDGILILLDRTAFYPRGGGQPADRGTLGGLPVLDVNKSGEEIWHLLPSLPRDPEGKDLPTGKFRMEGSPGDGTMLTGSVDPGHRREYQEQHTGQHILSAAFLEIGGYPTVSVHQGTDYTTIEFSVTEIPQEDLLRGEDRANQIITENRPVLIHWTDSEGLEDFRLRRPSKHQENIRIVEIPGVDQAACGGLHLSSTGQAQMVRLMGTEKIRGNIRTFWKIGRRAHEDHRKKTSDLAGLSALLSVPSEQASEKAREVWEQLQETRRELVRLREELVRFRARELAGTPEDSVPGVPLTAVLEEDPELFRMLGRELSSRRHLRFCLVNRRGNEIFWFLGHGAEASLPFPRIREELLPLIGGRGGGKPPFWQGAGSDPDGITPFLEAFRRLDS